MAEMIRVDIHQEHLTKERPLVAFVAWANSLALRVPEEHRSAAQIEFETEEFSYDVKVSVFYTRPKTEEDVQREGAQRAQHLAKEEELERRELARLVAKYGAPT